mgnify:CR=1 FL=1
MKILVTGATSGLGRNAVQYLLQSGESVVATGRNCEVGRSLTNAGAQDAIKAAFDDLDWEFERGTPTPYALVFREIDGNRYRAAIDLD